MPRIKKPASKALILKIYRLLFKAYGPQKWWPAKTPFEVIVGAILTQNTNWRNVEKAISALRKNGLLNPKSMYLSSVDKIAKAIRPSGYYNIKAKRLKAFMYFFFENYHGRVSRMKRSDMRLLRNRLLKVNGIGPETADSILLYALQKPVFVIDAYTKRISECFGLSQNNGSYDDLQRVFEEALPPDTKMFNEYHALIVRHAKEACKKSPECGRCVLNRLKKKLT
jgi:endonuclease III related protein